MSLDGKKFLKIEETLENSFGDVAILHRESPLSLCQNALEILIATVLTQATTDHNAMQAWLAFKKFYADFDSVVSGGRERLSEVIRPAGLAQQRSTAILEILEQVHKTFGEYSLESLANDADEAWKFLNALPKVGPKTAACVLLFAWDIPYFPVDVHIERIAKRLSWATAKETAPQIQMRLTAEVPTELHRPLHILLLKLGRTYCRPHKARCGECPLKREYCDGHIDK